jgi:hypothetical protein
LLSSLAEPELTKGDQSRIFFAAGISLFAEKGEPERLEEAGKHKGETP